MFDYQNYYNLYGKLNIHIQLLKYYKYILVGIRRKYSMLVPNFNKENLNIYYGIKLF